MSCAHISDPMARVNDPTIRASDILMSLELAVPESCVVEAIVVDAVGLKWTTEVTLFMLGALELALELAPELAGMLIGVLVKVLAVVGVAEVAGEEVESLAEVTWSARTNV